jgi:hypothetical protein
MSEETRRSSFDTSYCQRPGRIWRTTHSRIRRPPERRPAFGAAGNTTVRGIARIVQP